MPSELWERLRADPVRAPEHVALAAAEWHGPAAAAWAEAKRGRLAVSGADLARMAKRRHASLARLEGAATGVGGFITVVPDIVLLAWIQSRLVFFTAAAYGFDPRDPMRPAELLVLRDLYPDPQTARQALDGIGKTVAEAYVGSKLERGREQAVLLAAAALRGQADGHRRDPAPHTGRRDRLQRDRQRARHPRARRPRRAVLRRVMAGRAANVNCGWVGRRGSRPRRGSAWRGSRDSYLDASVMSPNTALYRRAHVDAIVAVRRHAFDELHAHRGRSPASLPSGS